eukprot:SAG11_NODE_44148_length_158_cov_22.542373_1_plen_28_part_10
MSYTGNFAKWKWGAYGYDDKMNKHLDHD